MDEIIKRGRGRPKKERLSDDDRLAELLLKCYDFSIDENGKTVLTRNTEVLSLDDTAFMIWNFEGRKTPKPLSNMMMIKTERKALEKIKAGLAKQGITKLSDVIGDQRTYCNKYTGDNSIDG